MNHNLGDRCLVHNLCFIVSDVFGLSLFLSYFSFSPSLSASVCPSVCFCPGFLEVSFPFHCSRIVLVGNPNPKYVGQSYFPIEMCPPLISWPCPPQPDPDPDVDFPDSLSLPGHVMTEVLIFQSCCVFLWFSVFQRSCACTMSFLSFCKESLFINNWTNFPRKNFQERKLFVHEKCQFYLGNVAVERMRTWIYSYTNVFFWKIRQFSTNNRKHPQSQRTICNNYSVNAT